MRSYLQFLTTPTADTPGTSLLLHFDNKRYLIGNIGEGTQRAAVQQGARLLKVSELLITGRTEWTNVGGLIGMILTLADSSSSSAASSAEDLKKKAQAKLRKSRNSDTAAAQQDAVAEAQDKPKLTIFGPSNLNYLLATARRFVFRKGMPVDVHEMTKESTANHGTNTEEWAPTWSDENIKVWAMATPAKGHDGHGHSPEMGSMSPRKRSFEEIEDDGDTCQPSKKEKAAMMAKSVVSEMFDSTWRLDALVETPIHEVKLPAALFVRDEVTGKLVKYTGPMPGGAQPVPDINVLVRRPWPGALVETLPPTEPGRETVSYIIRNHPQRGKFKPQRAKELGVGEGPSWSKLARGMSVLNDKGETITPDMVLGEGKEGGGVAIIDLPLPEYIEPLLARQEWRSEKVMAGVGAIVWILGPGLAQNSLIRSFMSEMKHVKHVISSPDLCANRLTYDSAAAATFRLRQVDPARYGVPDHDNTAAQQMSDDTFFVAERGQMVQLEPAIDLSNAMVPPLLDLDNVLSEMSPEVLELATKAREEVQNDRAALDAWANSLPQKDAEVITLGTGSALPSKYRNVSATLLRVPGWGSLLFDCGENTLGQLRRVYNPSELVEVLRDLRIIWISHMHADHHLGTVSVIRAWYEATHGANPAPVTSPASPGFQASALSGNGPRLSVISDSAMLHWLHEYSQVDDYGFSRIAPLCISPARPYQDIRSTLSWFTPPSQTEQQQDKTQTDDSSLHAAAAHFPTALLDLTDIQATPVQHCHGALAVSITFPSGFKASYSGDCRPSRAFARIGQGSTICIHEATFDDELRGDAEAKKHTTTSEALGIALAMGARACVLTHFSQRYQKVPVLEYTDQEDGEGVPVADTAGAANANANGGGGVEEEEEMADAPPDLPDSSTSAATAAPSAEPKQTTIKLKAGTDMKVCVAFDLMRVKVGDIAEMDKFNAPLIRLFAEEERREGGRGGVEIEEGDGGEGAGEEGGKGKGKGKGKGGQKQGQKQKGQKEKMQVQVQEKEEGQGQEQGQGQGQEQGLVRKVKSRRNN